MHKANKSHTSWSWLQLVLLASRAAYPRFYNRRALTHTHFGYTLLFGSHPCSLSALHRFLRRGGTSRSGTMLTSLARWGGARVFLLCVFMCVFLFGNEGEEVRFLRSELIQRPRVPQLPTVQTIIAVSEPQAEVGLTWQSRWATREEKKNSSTVAVAGDKYQI